MNAYAAAQQKAAFYKLNAGVLRVEGPDQVSFLQRQTSNDMGLLAPGRTLLNVLTSATARILDVVYILTLEDGALALLTLPGRAPATFRFLKKRIFFMDKVSLTDVSAESIQVDLLGPDARAALERLGAPGLPAPGEWVAFDFAGLPLRVLGNDPALNLGYRLVAPAALEPALSTALNDLAAPLDADTYTLLRVEAGLPGAGELVEAYTPFETGLGAAVSSSKGCYTGQEILARQVTYDKITQRLCGLRLDAPAAAGERVWVEARPAGEVTSAAVSPRLGPLALAVLRRPFFETGTAVRVGESAGTGTLARVSALPF